MSPLGEYLASLNHEHLDDYFIPEDLINTIKTLSTINYEIGNSQIIIANDDLQKCFNTKLIFVQDLYTLCLPHVNVVVNPNKLNELINNYVSAEFYIETPLEMLYKDPTASFWIPPHFNQIICNNQKMVYSWKELCTLFHSFVNTPNKHIQRTDESMFKINSNSMLSHEIRFEHFHKSQILTILKQIAKYLGKPSNILTLCPELVFDNASSYNNVINFIENVLFHNNRLMPYVPSYIHI